MTDRGIGDQLFHVRLHHGHQRAVDDSDERQNHDPGSILTRLLGEQAQIEAKHAVSAHLEQNTSQQNRSSGGGLYVSVRQPSVERKQRDFYGEGYKEPEKQPLR